jgi:ATP-dependent Zn protease
MYLGGIAAEILVFGEFTEGSAGHPLSDLGLATALATKVERSFGMGSTLMIDTFSENHLGRLPVNDHMSPAAVGELLDTELQRAKRILEARQSGLRAIADALLENHTMNAAQVRAVLSRHSLQKETPWGTSQPVSALNLFECTLGSDG